MIHYFNIGADNVAELTTLYGVWKLKINQYESSVDK